MPPEFRSRGTRCLRYGGGRESVQSLENQGPSGLVRLCQTIFYKKNMQAATENPYELRAFPMISNQFQSLL